MKINNTHKLCSIIICTYNHGEFLATAIDSAINQTYQNIEILVINDGSTDDTENILFSYRDRVKIITKKNGGQSSAYNIGFSHSSGEYILFLDADDLLLPLAIEKLVNEFEDDISKIQFKLQVFDENNKTHPVTVPKFFSSGYLGYKLTNYGFLYNSSPGTGNIYKRSVLSKIFPLLVPAFERGGADYYLIYGSALFGRIKSLDLVLGHYRILSKTDAKIGNSSYKDICEFYPHREKLFREMFSNINFKTDFCSLSLLKLQILNQVMSNERCHFFINIKRMIFFLRLENERGVINKTIFFISMIVLMCSSGDLKLYIARKLINPLSR